MELFLSALAEILIGETGKSVFRRLSRSKKEASLEPSHSTCESSLAGDLEGMFGDLIESHRLMRKQEKPNWLVSIITGLGMCNILLAVWLILMKSLLETDALPPSLPPKGATAASAPESAPLSAEAAADDEPPEPESS